MQSGPEANSENLANGTLPDAGAPIIDSANLSDSAVATARASAIDTSPPPIFLLNLNLLI
jgi:hypothetical protein